MKNTNRAYIFILAFLVMQGPLLFSIGQGSTIKADLPVLITSCGQSPGATMLKVIFMRLKLDFKPKAYEVNMLAAAEDLIAQKDTGIPYKSLIIVMGASLKGMGAAGISIDNELDRTSKLMEEAKNQGITIIGAHIEGKKRRAQGAAVGDNTDELSIDTVAPNSDYLIVNEDGNSDDRFSVISTNKNIPMILVKKNLDLLKELGIIYKK